MAKVKQLYVDSAGHLSDKHPHSTKKDQIIWIPESATDTIYINFLDNKSPFTSQELRGTQGSIVGGVVVNPPDDYYYQLTVATRQGDTINAAGDPEIIVDSGGGPEPRGSKDEGRSAQKKSGSRKSAGTKKKGGKKKAAKKR